MIQSRPFGLLVVIALQVLLICSSLHVSWVDPTLSDPLVPLGESLPSEKMKGMVAYAISITQCPSDNSTIEVFDAPAVLARSIHLNSRRHDSQKSVYDYRLIAFVHPLALNCTKQLEWIGYEVQVRPEPITVEEIREAGANKFSNMVRRKGCCGVREFMKLYAFTLTEFEVVVHFDNDVILLQPLDQLYDALRTNNFTNVKTFRIPDTSNSDDQLDFTFTRDYAQMSTLTANPLKYGVQGGFFVTRPNLTTFDLMIDKIREGHYGYFGGWGNKQYGGYYGAPQVQGFLSFFYGEIQPQRAVELNPCTYSTLQSLHSLDKKGKCRFGTDVVPCPDCNSSRLSDVKLTHFTTCYKPWWCPKARASELCRSFIASWFQMRRSFEISRGMRVALPEKDVGVKQYLGYCKDFKRENYIPMDQPRKHNAT